ncbi:MAG: hypothetical protein BGO82_06450 [Devosia sp. 67-54]|uniref:dipeptidase n=1 Tax=unclassified Devosia TaxID=196773 RepID=UPI00095F3D5B|nr:MULTISPECIES: membrane dipeptidase [unclassified Devosia]MBN9307543.1 membrane dipeptidase [Devosia sp.]OJX19916.1 MAG: hypothetical protein BGO82_06450 [Devosia sp. 67-54]
MSTLANASAEQDLKTLTAQLQADNIVWNICDTTQIQHADAEYAKKIIDSGMTASVHTVLAYDVGAAEAMERMIRWRRFYEESGLFMLGLKAGDSAEAKRRGKVAMYIAWQDIGPLEGRIDLINAFYDLGLRVLQPTYQRRSLAGDGCGERHPAGLSLFGIELVKRCNELGIGLDVSHVSEPTTLDMVEFSSAPILATHVGAKSINDNIRNKSDREIKAIAAKGGLIGVVGKSGFLKADGLKKGTTLDDYVDHVVRICELVGPDHVSIGTDIADERKYSAAFLGEFNKHFPENSLVDENMKIELIHPSDLQSPRYLPNITETLLRRQFSEGDVKKIIGGNAERVMAEILRPRRGGSADNGHAG